MRVEMSEEADFAVRTLRQEDRQSVLAWLGHLRHWEDDPVVRTQSHRLASSDKTFVLQANNDLRLFFTKENGTITVFDIAKRPALLAAAGTADGSGS